MDTCIDGILSPFRINFYVCSTLCLTLGLDPTLTIYRSLQGPVQECTCMADLACYLSKYMLATVHACYLYIPYMHATCTHVG